jgi:glycosyltransferase involved in cell wall biosynthesis
MARVYLTVTTDLNYDQRMMRICSSLASAGHRVCLVGRELPSSLPLQARPYEQRRLRCWFHRGKLFYLEYNIRLFCWLLFRRWDTLCSVDLDTLLPGFLLHRLLGRKLVYDAHEYFTEVPELQERPRIKALWEALANWIIPRLKHCYTVGSGLAQLMEARYSVPFGVVRNVPRASPFPDEPRTLSWPVILLYQGALNEGRGLEAMLEAMTLLPEAELWLAGEGDLSELLRRRAEALNLGERVRFWGFLLPEALQALTPQASIGLNLLENKGLSYYYSLANKAFDYVQAGLPSLQMDFPEYRRLNEEYEAYLLVPNLEPETLANQIRRLLDEPGLYAHLHQNCRAAAQTWTWEQEEGGLLQYYEL